MIVFKSDLTTEQSEIALEIAKSLKLEYETARLMYTRGINNLASAQKFISPSKANFSEPFALRGMTELKDRVTVAKNNEEKVVIYGDYDADGICATAIMAEALGEYMVATTTVIPEREEGYGLNEKAIEELLEKLQPDLLITVDCGISSYREVELLKSRGIDVIITDHHELPPILPDCIVVNPKQSVGSYAENLCGAGVAFKVACALIGQKAYELLDYAAVATIADSMPLIGENRDIVCEGMKLLRGHDVRPSFRELISVCNLKAISSTALAYSLAPRINAAGRMGDVYSALKLFMSTNSSEIHNLAEKLNKYNTERQQECENLYLSAKQKLIAKGAFSNIIILAGDDWKTGFIGIVAARLAEEFYRPCILFAKNGDFYKGSARSIDGINIFEAISHSREYLIEFGGHAQAAGIAIAPDKLDAFELAMEKYLSKNCSPDVFAPKCEAEFEINEPFSMKFATELNRLEPFGSGNKKPLFVVSGKDMSPAPLKNGSPHMSLKNEYIPLLFFSGVRYADIFRHPIIKRVVFEPNITTYNGNDSLKGYVREFEVDDSSLFGNDIYLLKQAIINMKYRRADTEGVKFLTDREVSAKIKELRKRTYGALFVAGDKSVVDKWDKELGDLPRSIYLPKDRTLRNSVVISPMLDGDYSGYRDVVYLDNPLGCYIKASGNLFAAKAVMSYSFVEKLMTERDIFTELFILIRDRLVGKHAYSAVDLYQYVADKYSKEQFLFVFAVFSELNLLSLSGGVLKINREVRSELHKSAIYANVCEVLK